VENDSIPSDVRIMGAKNGPLDQWCAMAVGPDGSIYLSSGASGKIVRYSHDGEMVREIGSVGFLPGDLLAPDDVFFARMSPGEPPLLTVASKGNRSWVQFDDAGAPVRVFQPLETAGPFADTLVGRFHADPDGERVYGLDLANRSLITFGGKGIEACGAYSIFLPGRTMALAAAALLLIGTASYVRSRSALPRLPRVRVPVFVKILILFIPILVLTARFVAVGVNDTMKEEVRAESSRRSANLAQAVLNSLSLQDLELIQNPEDREGPVYARVHETICRILGGGKVEQTPKWILHKIKDGRYYYGVNIWRGAIFMPCVVPKERQMFFRTLKEKTPQYGRYTDDEGEWVSYLAPVTDRSGNVIYVLELYRQAEELDRAQGLVARRVAQTVAVIVLATILLLSIFSYLFTWPLRQLTRRTEIISAGNFEQSVDIRHQDELGDLARAFNKMVVDLKGYTLELARTAAERESFESELRLARQLQEDVLPRVFPPLANTCNVALHAEVMPAREVGGDYYDFFLVDDSHLGVVVADVSGKGVPAGLFMMRIRALLRASAMGNLSPADTLSRINQLIVPENPSAMFATLFYFICHMGSGRIVYCNAGHNPPFRLRNGRAAPVGMENGEGKGLPIGIMEDAGYTDGFFEMGADDVLVVYSDGVTDSSNAEGDFFGEENLAALLASTCAHHPKEICQKVLDRVKAHQGAANQFDDITILAFRRCGDGDDRGRTKVTVTNGR
jgi:serine phosphatase RsbU (regulator of sigma subunit)/HAMP domain-containing protein